MGKSYIGDVGTVLKVTTGYDFTEDASASCSLMLQYPDGTTTELDATISSNLTEAAAGVVRYYIPEALDQTGTYKLQAFVEAGDSTNQWYGSTVQFVITALWR